MPILGFLRPQHDSTEFQCLRDAVLQLNSSAQVAENASFGYCLTGPDVAADGGYAVALQGRPRWQDRPIDAGGLLRLMRDEGVEVAARVKGAFAVVLCDGAERRAVLAIDRMGVERLTHYHDTTGLLFATNATALRRIPGVDARIRSQSIYDYFFFHVVPAPNTVFDKVRKLPPAHSLEWRDGRAAERRYWQATFVSQSSTSVEHFRDELYSLLESATRGTEPDGHTGAFLSGGIDSSTVAGFLTKVAARQVATFSMGFGISEYDELKYARITARHFGCKAHEYNVTPADTVDVFGRIARAYDEPFGNSSAVPTYYCAKVAAENGVTHLLAGDGGDELFGGNERYGRHKLLDAYTAIPETLRKGLIEPLTSSLSRIDFLPPVRKVCRYVANARVPLPDRLGSNFAFSVGLSNVLSTKFAAAVDAASPMKQMREVFSSIEADSLLDRMLAYDWRFTLADNDLRKVGKMCELAGVKVSFPLLDDDLVEFSTRVPAAQKMRGTQLRSFYKKAMRGFLPNEVLAKEKHGFGLPFGVWLKTDQRLRDLIQSDLADLDARGLFEGGFIPGVLEQHRLGPASYFGYFIWDLAMLEEWLKAHA